MLLSGLLDGSTTIWAALMARDELAGWLHGMTLYAGGGSDRPFWLEALAHGPSPQKIDLIDASMECAAIRKIEWVAAPNALKKMAIQPEIGSEAAFGNAHQLVGSFWPM